MKSGLQPDGSFIIDGQDERDIYGDPLDYDAQTRGVVRVLPQFLTKYSEDQPRDDHGRWSETGAEAGGAAGGAASAKPDISQVENLYRAADWIKEKSVEEIFSGRSSPKVSGLSMSGMIDVGGQQFFAKKAENEREAFNEKQTYEFAKTLGWDDVVAPTTVVETPDGGSVILENMLPKGQVLASSKNLNESDTSRHDRLFLLEYAIAAEDRHHNNYWVDDQGKLYGIDYSRAFSYYTEPSDLLALSHDGAWDRSRLGPRTTVARADVENIINHADKLRNIVEGAGGWEDSRSDDVRLSKFNERLDTMNGWLKRTPSQSRVATGLRD